MATVLENQENQENYLMQECVELKVGLKAFCQKAPQRSQLCGAPGSVNNQNISTPQLYPALYHTSSLRTA